MKAGWCFPFRERCGISIYSQQYISHLRNHCEIEIVNTDDLSDYKKIISRLNECDIVHIQYEPSFFIPGIRDSYLMLLRQIQKPVVVSLHEIYREFPGVYPRNQIKGNYITSVIKKNIYDFRHPLQTMYRKHCKKAFGASAILVHHCYHKAIISEANIPSEKILVMPMPVLKTSGKVLWSYSGNRPLIIGSTGFINPSFDYEFLFEMLDKLPVEWKFIWIGGVRSDEQKNIYCKLVSDITARGWEDKFIISGWVDECTQGDLLRDVDIYAAFFSKRSSSASLARAIGAGKLIVSFEDELTSELNTLSRDKPLVFIEKNVERSINFITKLLSNKSEIDTKLAEVERFADQFKFSSMAESLSKLYSLICNQRLNANELPERVTI